MGGKVSGKMAAAGRVVQVVRPHAPLIKFPNRQGLPKPNVQEAMKMIIANPAAAPSPSSAAPPSLLSPSRAPGPVSRLPGIPDTLATVRDFPQKYRRRPVAEEEMEYIQRGGPE